MAVAYKIYLFDLSNFSLLFTPALKQLSLGNSQMLKDIAHRLSKEKEDVWDILENYRFYPGDIGAEDSEFDSIEEKAKFWTMIILASFCVPVEIPPSYLEDMIAFLHEVGTDNTLIEKMMRGKSLDKLFAVMLDGSELSFAEGNFGKHFGMVGWLDFRDIQEILGYLTLLDVKYSSGVRNNKLMDKRKALAYQAAKRIFFEASTSSKGLFLSITD